MTYLFTGTRSKALRKLDRSPGFTLIELMVATVVFLIIGGAAFTLFHRHARLFGDQQNQVALNVSMRNALSLLQIDTVNAGTGYYGRSQYLKLAHWRHYHQQQSGCRLMLRRGHKHLHPRMFRPAQYYRHRRQYPSLSSRRRRQQLCKHHERGPFCHASRRYKRSPACR